MAAFEVLFPYTTHRVYSSCTIINPTDSTKSISCRALWDTGAMASGMTRELAESLGLSPVSTKRVSDFHGTYDDNVYWVNVRLSNSITFSLVEASEGKIGDCDFLIGMDIISKGDFCLCNENGETSLSFRTPSGSRILLK